MKRNTKKGISKPQTYAEITKSFLKSDKLAETLRELAGEHDPREIFERFLDIILVDRFNGDMHMSDVIDVLFKKEFHDYSKRAFLNEDDQESIIYEVEAIGYKCLKANTLAEQIKIDAFLEELEHNPYQLQLI